MQVPPRDDLDSSGEQMGDEGFDSDVSLTEQLENQEVRFLMESLIFVLYLYLYALIFD